MYLAEGDVLKRASTQRATPEDLAQDVVTFYPTGDSVLFSTSAGGLYSLEPSSLESRLVYPLTEPVEVAWADADHALGNTREGGWFYVTSATGDLLMLDALDGAYLVAGLRPESDAAWFSDSLDIGDPRTFWGLELTTGRVTKLESFLNSLTGPAGDGGLLLSVFDYAETSTELYRLNAHEATFLFRAPDVSGALSPDGRFVAVDERVGRPDDREAKGLTLLLDATGTLVGELGQGGHGVLWLSEPE